METTIPYVPQQAGAGPGRAIPAKRIKTRHAESHLQRQAVAWFKLQHRNYEILAIPNGGGRSKAEAAILKGEGVLAGTPDLLIPVMRGGYGGCWIELKTETGRLSPEQKERIAYLQREGYLVQVIRTLEDFMELVNAYLSNSLSRTPPPS